MWLTRCGTGARRRRRREVAARSRDSCCDASCAQPHWPLPHAPPTRVGCTTNALIASGAEAGRVTACGWCGCDAQIRFLPANPPTHPPPLPLPQTQAGGARLKPVDVEAAPAATPASRSATRRRTVVACGVTVAAVIITALLLARHFAGALGVPVGGSGDGTTHTPSVRAAGWKHAGPGAVVTPPETHAAAAAAAHHDPTATVHHEEGGASEHAHEAAASHHEAMAQETPAADHHTHATGETHAHEGGALPHEHATADGHSALDTDMPADADTP